MTAGAASGPRNGSNGRGRRGQDGGSAGGGGAGGRRSQTLAGRKHRRPEASREPLPPPPAPPRDASGRRGGPGHRIGGGRGRSHSPPRPPRPRPRASPAPPCPARPAPVWQRLMAAVGPPQQQVRMAQQQVWAALEVALRVPCLYIIDAIFNSYYDSSQSRFCIGLQIFLRLLGKDSGLACGPRRALPRGGRERLGAGGTRLGEPRSDSSKGPFGGVRGPVVLVPALTAEWCWRVCVLFSWHLGRARRKHGCVSMRLSPCFSWGMTAGLPRPMRQPWKSGSCRA